MIFFCILWKKSFSTLKYFSLVLFFTQPANAQNQNNFSFHHLTSADGLTSNNVGKIIQDSRGFLWICTEDGLNMYDGQTIKQYYLSDYIPSQANSNVISGIAEDADQNMLIAAKAGIVKFSWNTKQFSVVYKNPFTSFGNANLDLFVDATKNIWVNERVRIKKFDANFNLLHTWNLRDSINSKNLNGPSVTSIVGEDWHHNIWFSDSSSVFKIDAISNKIDSSLNTKLKTINPVYTSCSQMSFTENSVWMVVNNYTLLHFNSSFQLIDKFELSKLIVPYYSGVIEQNGKAWIATRFNGVLVLDIRSGIMQHYNENSSLSSDDVNSIIKDSSQNIWISTIKGISEWQVNTSFFHQLVFNSSRNSIAQKYSVQKIFFENNILYTFVSNGIIQTRLSDNQSKYFFDPDQKLSGGVYYSSAFSYGNNWLLSRHNDLEFLQFKNRLPVFSLISLSHPSKLDSSRVVAFYEDENKNIWMGLADERGVICWHTNDNSFEIYSQKDTGKNYCPLRHLSYAAEDDKGNIWMGYDKGGVSIFDKIQNRFASIPLQEKNSVANVSVLGIINDHNGNIWIATNTGLFQYNETKNYYKLFTRKDGLPSNFAKSITADKLGNVWAGFEGALAEINISSNSITTFNTTDGLPDEDLENPFYDTLSGTMFFCTARSVIYFNAEQVKKIIPLLKPVVTSFEVMGNEQPLIPGKKINIPYSQNYVSFSFSAPNFINASETEYACKLDGADKNWNYISNHHVANYSQLQPGNYIFKVMARVKGGTWQQAATSVVLNIQAPFWRTAWFWIVSIVLIFSVVFAFAYLKFRNKLEQQILAQSIRDKIAGDLHDDIGSTLSSISILSELAKQRSSEVTPFLNRIEENTSMMQENMSDIVWAINPKNDRFGNIIQRMSQFAAELLEAKNMEVRFISDDSLAALSLSMEKRKNFYLLYKEAINNCAKYSNATLVSISILNSDHHISLIITDNGNGFDTSKKYNGNGMDTMRKRAADLKGNLKIFSEKNKGTTVNLSFKI